MSWGVRAPVTGGLPICNLPHSGVLTLPGVLQANLSEVRTKLPLDIFPAPSVACTHPTFSNPQPVAVGNISMGSDIVWGCL